MNITALIVGSGIAKVLAAGSIGDIGRIDPKLDIQRIGYCGLTPVYLDTFLPPDELMIAYKLDPSESGPDRCMVDRCRKQLLDNPDNDDWILLAEQLNKSSEALR